MLERSDGPSGSSNPESAFGGADAVNDTPQRSGHGADVGAHTTDTVQARVSAGSGLGIVGWMLVILAIIVAAAYLAGVRG